MIYQIALLRYLKINNFYFILNKDINFIKKKSNLLKCVYKTKGE